ncbi:hypothetical protein E2C01_050432 [Portunus trituberculatus]|uniref:Uncharacterized protein n=1 Tax=Portunus trituberculatus TaxID=210409 RepID=A0A5B7GC28_PORTR|nr:hypothetical protein [Portunus trituberculatus]
MKEKNPNEFTREHEEKELAKTIIKKAQDSTQELDQEVEEVIRDMDLEEREKEKVLRNEAKEKNKKRTEIKKKTFYWRALDMRLKKWYLQKKEEVMEEARN